MVEDDDDGPCTNCWGSGYDGNREARCHCLPPLPKSPMVEVTEADRLALDHHRGRIFQFRRNNDDEHMLDTLSRHRTASTAAKEARIVELEAALSEAIEWDSHDSEGVPAVWLDRARKALGEG